MYNLNGQITREKVAMFTPDNRSLRYGDSVFESIRVIEGRIPFFSRHWRRLQQGMEALRMEPPPFFTAAYAREQIIRTLDNENARIRLMVFRSGGGLYTPETNLTEYLIESHPLDGSGYELNEAGLGAGISSEAGIFPSSWSFCKTGNSLPQVLAGIEMRSKEWDTILLKNPTGGIACAFGSNIFIVRNGKLVTPPLSEGCVAGVMRSVVCDFTTGLDLELLESPVREKDLAAADEILLTNAVRGIRWVQKIEGMDTTYSNKTGKRIWKALQKTVREEDY